MSAPLTDFAAEVQARLDAQARPPGSLPLLDSILRFLATAQATAQPAVDRPHVLLFAGDHGVAKMNKVSPYPVGVTPLMERAIVEGTATVSVLARQAGATLELVDVGVATSLSLPAQLPEGLSFVSAPVGRGTKDMSVEPAMSPGQVQAALAQGAAGVDRALQAGADLIALGELGIGNTTAAAALSAQLLRLSPLELVGPGTGLDAAGVKRKAAVIQRAFDRVEERPSATTMDALAQFGGFELAAMTGAILQAERHHLPVLLDGFVVSAAALAAVNINPEVRKIMYPATQSTEPGHRLVLDTLSLARPIFDAQLHLGEASGAALALPVVRAACAVLRDTALLEDVMPK